STLASDATRDSRPAVPAAQLVSVVRQTGACGAAAVADAKSGISAAAGNPTTGAVARDVCARLFPRTQRTGVRGAEGELVRHLARSSLFVHAWLAVELRHADPGAVLWRAIHQDPSVSGVRQAAGRCAHGRCVNRRGDNPDLYGTHTE